MTTTIDTLVEDILRVIDGRTWDATINDSFKTNIGNTMMDRLTGEDQPRGTLRMSSIGQPCRRKGWYQIHCHEEEEALTPTTKFKFLFGDIFEEVLLSLAEAAGHKVEGQQGTVRLHGIKGHRDAVIDGVTVDVKSAASHSFLKFKNHTLDQEGQDSFGYLTQLSSYVKAAENDPLVTDKKGGAFLAQDKQFAHLVLDYWDFEETGHLDALEETYTTRISDVADETGPPDRDFEPVKQSKTSPNMKLPPAPCGYCGFKKKCFPEVRTFLYSGGPVYLTTVVKRPQAHVMEITE